MRDIQHLNQGWQEAHNVGRILELLGEAVIDRDLQRRMMLSRQIMALSLEGRVS